jgi:hypothetical protein
LFEWLADNQVTNVRLRRLAVPDTYLHELGNQAYTRSRLGLDTKSLFRTFEAELVLMT